MSSTTSRNQNQRKKMKTQFAVLVSIILLSSKAATGQDLNMVSSLVSYGLGAIQDCAKENNAGLMKMATAVVFSRIGADKNSKCAIACVMERFFLIADDKVETGMLAQVVDMIPIEALKGPVAELISTCGNKGNGPNKCENANTFIICLKQNGMTTAAKALFQG